MANNHLRTDTPLDNYDKGWVDLIFDAKRDGISRDEIRSFLTKSNPINKIPKSS